MLVMVVFFIAFRWIHLSTPLIRLFLLVLILLLMPTLNFLPVWFALSLLRFRLPSRLPMMFILWMVAMMVVIIPSDRKSGSAGMPRPISYAVFCLKKKGIDAARKIIGSLPANIERVGLLVNPGPETGAIVRQVGLKAIQLCTMLPTITSGESAASVT